MKKQITETITRILAMLLVTAMLAACGQNDAGENDTAQDTSSGTTAVEENKDTAASETDAPETKAPETESPETTAPVVEPVTSELPAQGEVPCDFSDSLDLSAEITASEFSLTEGGGQWVLGHDGAQMTAPLTEELLNEYKYFAFTYECDDCDSDSEIACGICAGITGNFTAASARRNGE